MGMLQLSPVTLASLALQAMPFVADGDSNDQRETLKKAAHLALEAIEVAFEVAAEKGGGGSQLQVARTVLPGAVPSATFQPPPTPQRGY